VSFANEYIGDVTIPIQFIKHKTTIALGGSANQIAVFTSN
jgi:hypothetical protein